MNDHFDKDGLYLDMPSSISLFGGGRIDPLNPRAEDIDFNTIAHSLSQQCRWTGHTSHFYSVAEHCVLVSLIEPTMEALLHDATEAFLSDLARPIKKANGLGDAYMRVEDGLEKAVAERFNLQHPWPQAVKDADEAMLYQEYRTLFPCREQDMPAPPEGTPEVRCWEPVEAESYFLLRGLWLKNTPTSNLPRGISYPAEWK